MAFIEIHGPCRIQGGLTVQGSKNAVLPMMAASVLNRGITVLENVPRIQDVFCMMGILDSLGCRCALHGNRLEIDTSKMNGWRIEQKAMGKMRSSIMLLGALLGRFCEAGVYSPGRMYDRKTSNRLAFAGTPCAGRGNTGTGVGRLPACTDNGTSRGRDYFSVSECRRGGKCPVCRCGSGGADGSAGMRAGTGDWTAVPFPKWYGGIDPGDRDGCADHRRRIAAP